LKYLICGLGNIGDEYANTRHNIGFWVLDSLAKELNIKFEIGRHAYIAEAKYKGRTLILIKPTTYMNLSGKAIKYWLDKENISKENLLVVVDDLALEPGILRMKKAGSDGGHNGLIHITETLLTKDFARLRFGIGNDFAKGYQVDYVLGKWTRKEEDVILPKVDMAVDVIKNFTTIGVERTMNFFNNKK
jgi:PTH1 family peptidyl-tRNA hydrolase